MYTRHINFTELNIYGIGGLGVDEQVFTELDVGFEIIPLKWISPLQVEELSEYAMRFSEQIDAEKPFALIGVSFGGIMALELNKFLKPEKTILISSATSKTDIPKIFRILGKAGLLNIIPDRLLNPPPFLANYFFGVQDRKYQVKLKSILDATDSSFLRWAVKIISHWDNSLAELPTNVVRLHGTADKLLKCPDNKISKLVPKAGHFMIVDRAKEISQLLNLELKS